MKSYEGGVSFDAENRMNPQLEEVLEAFTAFALARISHQSRDKERAAGF